jgi:hypothetical protein
VPAIIAAVTLLTGAALASVFWLADLDESAGREAGEPDEGGRGSTPDDPALRRGDRARHPSRMKSDTRHLSSAYASPAEQAEPSSRRMAWVKLAGSVLILLVLLVPGVVVWL